MSNVDLERLLRRPKQGYENMKLFRIAAILVVAIAAGVYGWRQYSAKVSAKPKIGRTVTAKNGSISILVLETGTLEPVTQNEVKSKVAGRVMKIFVKEGDEIKAGDPIALIDPIEVTREVEQIKAQLSAAQAGYEQSRQNLSLTIRQNEMSIKRAEAGLTESQARLAQTTAPNRRQDIEQQEAAVRRAESTLLRSKAQLADSERNLARQKALSLKGFVAQSAVDSAQTNVEVQKADLASSQTELASTKERLSLLMEGTRKEDIVAAKAQVESARIALESERTNAANAQLRARDVERSRAQVEQIQNQLAQQQVQLKETNIVAPISGQVISKSINEGELVASATGGFAQGAVLVKIADLSKMQVKVNINEVDVARLKVGLPANIRVDGVKGQVFKGVVASLAPASIGSNSTSSTGSSVVRFEVKVAVTTPDNRLRPGMTAAVDIVLDQKDNILTLPAEALTAGDKVSFVTGNVPDEATSQKSVTVGLRNNAVVEIVSGLKAGDKVEVPKIDAKDRRKINFDGPDNK
jgi:HlyD family secretion protein